MGVVVLFIKIGGGGVGFRFRVVCLFLFQISVVLVGLCVRIIWGYWEMQIFSRGVQGGFEIVFLQSTFRISFRQRCYLRIRQKNQKLNLQFQMVSGFIGVFFCFLYILRVGRLRVLCLAFGWERFFKLQYGFCEILIAFLVSQSYQVKFLRDFVFRASSVG